MDSQSSHVPSMNQSLVCPTDNRLRPDQRIMENADYDNANIEKVYSNI